MQQDIVHLEEIVDSLPESEKRLFDAFFLQDRDMGERIVPSTFVEKALQYFKKPGETKEQTLRRVRKQIVVHTVNRWTGEQAYFNEIRTSKPGTDNSDIEKKREEVYKSVNASRKNCDFCNPKKYTTRDMQRIEKFGGLSASNAAAYTASNGLIVFREHNPLELILSDLGCAREIACEWFERTNKKNPHRVYPVIGWNCLKRAGASLDHTHMHILLAKFADEDTTKLRAASEYYRTKTHRNYFEDLYTVHEALGLGLKHGKSQAKLMVSLVPRKDKEVCIIADSIDELQEAIFDVYRCYVERLGAFAFNMTIQMPPLNKQKDWKDFPYIAKFVERGDATKMGTDIAFMELLLRTSIIGSDSFKVAQILREYIGK